ncbi:hypothetical protein [Nocardia sp. NPDC002869]|uniref:hypothetical protein n=1 Tax=Nocardia sp. NPDC002869 TaxID=3161032 RepID=UPI00398CD6E1
MTAGLPRTSSMFRWVDSTSRRRYFVTSISPCDLIFQGCGRIDRIFGPRSRREYPGRSRGRSGRNGYRPPTGDLGLQVFAELHKLPTPAIDNGPSSAARQQQAARGDQRARESSRSPVSFTP